MASQPTPNLLTKEIQDLYIRKNFQNLVAYFSAQNQLLNFSFFELNITTTPTGDQNLTHNLGFIPKDIIVTHTTGVGVVQFKYASFTDKILVYTAIAPCRIRFFVGTYWNDPSTVQAQSSDVQMVQNI